MPGAHPQISTISLRTRVAALLATDDDAGKALFDDVGQLYGLRSRIVHGGQIKQKDLRKVIARISTVPEDAAEHFGIALGYAVDRMRDLVRRAILARLCLAAEPDPLWPFDGETAVDATLADDMRRAAWRERWHARLAALGVEYAAGRPRSAVDFLSQEDR
jgi:Apea-like HEPN